jgi:septal ring factor EnvC (AmiA/AmiB activator)
MAAQAARLAAERAIQAGKASALDRQIASIRNDAGEAERAAKAADERAAALAAQAETLRGAIAAIDAAHARARGTHATMLTPVAGPVLRTWGSPAEDGPATGITFGSAPGAFVSSPCAGRVAFAAPFRSYGRLLIIECAGGDDVVLAGLERLDAPLGRAVRAGEPVGRMPDYDPGKTRGRPGLYMELRSAGLGQPQDPVPFLKAHG